MNNATQSQDCQLQEINNQESDPSPHIHVIGPKLTTCEKFIVCFFGQSFDVWTSPAHLLQWASYNWCCPLSHMYWVR